MFPALVQSLEFFSEHRKNIHGYLFSVTLLQIKTERGREWARLRNISRITYGKYVDLEPQGGSSSLTGELSPRFWNQKSNWKLDKKTSMQNLYAIKITVFIFFVFLIIFFLIYQYFIVVFFILFHFAMVEREL